MLPSSSDISIQISNVTHFRHHRILVRSTTYSICRIICYVTFQVVNWLCHVLDSHFTQLVLSTEARDILLELHAIVEAQVRQG